MSLSVTSSSRQIWESERGVGVGSKEAPFPGGQPLRGPESVGAFGNTDDVSDGEKSKLAADDFVDAGFVQGSNRLDGLLNAAYLVFC